MRALTLAVVALLVLAAPAGAEQLTVRPATKPEDRVTSTLVVQPAHKYRLTVSGFVTATNAKGERETHDAFYCFAGACEPPLKGSALYATPEGYTLTSPIPMTKAKQSPAFHSDHTYVLILDAIPKAGRMVFDALPHGSPTSGVTWSGQFDVTLEDINPPCRVGTPAVPKHGHHFVAWRFTQGGPPTRHPSDLKDSITAGRGLATIAGVSHGEADLHAVRGSTCHKDRYDVGESGLLGETLKLGFVSPDEIGATSVKVGKNGRHELIVDFEVEESEDPDCPVGTPGVMSLIDAGPGRKSKDRLKLGFPGNGSACAAHAHTYRNVNALIRTE